MFKKSKPAPQPPETINHIATTAPAAAPRTATNDRAEVNTLIGNTTTLEGDVHFSGVLKIDGTILGNLVADSANSVLILDEEGRIEGEVRVPSMIINGSIQGNVFASEKIDLYPNAKIVGDVHYNLLEMEVGAEVNGRMLRQQDGQVAAAQPQQPVMIEPAGQYVEAT